MNFNEWSTKILDQRPSTSDIRWGQAVMNASPVEWRDDLPDIWEIDYLHHPDVLLWYERAEKEFH